MTLGWRSGEPRRWTTFKDGRDLKIDMQLPWCIPGTSITSKTTKTPLRNLLRPLRLHDDTLETHRRWSNFQVGRDFKIHMQLPWCILGTSIMWKPTETPLRNLLHPLRLHDDAMETHRRWSTFQVGRDLKIDISFLDISLGHQFCQKPPRLLSGTYCEI